MECYDNTRCGKIITNIDDVDESLFTTYEIQSLSVVSVEIYLHKVFADKRLKVSLKFGNGKLVDAKEWFVVSLADITEVIN